ncbi:TssA family type VI secretion system protein [Fluoribacter dumoffii]|uniref:TssA family type VI secretion system protein n=1 Tax=Fluoribacter dumoffii TaxID=463 RepID=UPI00026C7C1B|nr:TssA family type VI secretion system protein [Fluoribacter dumoffii]MCW8416761.1 TssA family type VI secretion system protein [Fluoribacter dumoffii]MCW8455399.1 TssA family type VI secretion system protein [Fluoribacter dumoffii]MCW8460523.1 TssA family type VI secretion system protein [Fluoribacter dumoffii]MCW8484004.1 TssA family type VI secretion system protein [Fluoribacter dumoffii]
MFRIDSISKLGTQPIPGSNRVGQQCYEFSQYTQIRNEIQKLARIGQSSNVDWIGIIDNSIELLTYHTKDLQIAAYLAFSLFHQYQFKGLAAGLNFLFNFIINFWEEAYPQGRLHAKIEALNWYASCSLNHLSRINLDKEDEEFQQEIIYLLKNFESELLTRAINCHLFANLREKIELLNTFAPIIEQKEESVIEFREFSHQKESNIHLEPALLTLTQFARELMEKDPSNPYAYYLNRIAAWAGINALPYNEEGQTLVKPPEYFNRERIRKVLNLGNLSEIIITVEEIIPQEPFWLDLNFISLNSLKKLDGKFNQAYEATKLELRHFLKRIPGVELLKFNDGTSFLSEDYLEQVQSLTAKKIAFTSVSEKKLSAIEQKQLQQIKEAMAQFDKKKQNMNFHQLELIHKESISNKIKLLVYMSVCESLIAENETALLKPYTDFIVELVEYHQLVTWEPSLALEALIVAFRCMKFLKNRSSTQEMDRVFSLITKMDMNAARELAQP